MLLLSHLQSYILLHSAVKVGETCVAEEDICSSNAECADAKCKCDRLYVEEEGKCTEMSKKDTRL